VPNLQQQTPRQPLHVKVIRKGPASITRVLADLMVFVAFELDKNEDLVGLVFKPDKIVGYGGETLKSIGLTEGASIPEIVWDQDTFLVQEVEIEHFRGRTPPEEASA
jgi:hypothetical protein